MCIKVYHGESDKLHVAISMSYTEFRLLSVHFKRAHQRASDTKVRCSFCNHILYKSHWVEAESLVDGKAVVSLEVTYGICPKC